MKIHEDAIKDALGGATVDTDAGATSSSAPRTALARG
jgi:hypothetical protein